MYQLTADNAIKLPLEDGSVMFLPAENNGTPEWRKYQAWLDAGNTPLPAVAPPGPRPDYQLLYDSILGGAVYRKIRGQATTSLPLTLACVEFIAAMADAKAGNANVPALQSCLTNIATAATSLNSADWAEIGSLLEESNLAGVFQLP